MGFFSCLFGSLAASCCCCFFLSFGVSMIALRFRSWACLWFCVVFDVGLGGRVMCCDAVVFLGSLGHVWDGSTTTTRISTGGDVWLLGLLGDWF